MSFNKIIIVGNLGRDPELRYTPQGAAVCSFTMATNEKRRDKSGELQDITTWFKITLWRQQAENAAKYLTKGSPVYIEGRLKIEEWTDRDNNKRYTLDVQATDMQFIGSRGEGGGGGEYSGGHDDHDSGYTGGSSAPSSGGGGGSSSPTPPVSTPAADDDIPF
ncbi:MAG TPA: single-stranded DNA-binding protein [Pyrinomonadaceae bacterium]|nr:single-stranded DNA-binding protein [Chloracidobacterium sp.]MBP9936421.1 single-stranded DNA-binding protein [Pyrinomonadaceae bacterium]MBK9439352.1 single-stranded DNA-binding protein [Chloracidobacterium sp.]MBL0239361.1 single-stranded DNA-binding protein [Chloracidobacterium sp.]HQX57432.1 single-stranded DNA-binding protein [Pyrinomonadaceae bacterium]